MWPAFFSVSQAGRTALVPWLSRRQLPNQRPVARCQPGREPDAIPGRRPYGTSTATDRATGVKGSAAAD